MKARDLMKDRVVLAVVLLVDIMQTVQVQIIDIIVPGCYNIFYVL